MKIKLSTAIVLHILLITGQFLNMLTTTVPAKYQFLVAGALAIVQALVGILQHYSPQPGTAGS